MQPRAVRRTASRRVGRAPPRPRAGGGVSTTLRSTMGRVPTRPTSARIGTIRTTDRTGSQLNVLFIGNSFTARNDLPGLISRLAQAKGKSLRHDLVSRGGASLRAHWNAGDAARRIASREYDRVVLQEQSTLPLKNPERMHENVRLVDEATRSAGAKTLLYLTWAREHTPESQQAITDAYASIGEELGATVVPAGLAWQRFLTQHDQPALYERDGSHPTLA